MKSRKKPRSFSHSQTVLITLHHSHLLLSAFPFMAKFWKFLTIFFKKNPNFMSHYILWGFQRDVLMAQACFDVTALHRVGEWHAESKLLKWEPHWEHVNLMLHCSYPLRRIPKLTCEGFMIKSSSVIGTGTQTVRGCFQGLFSIQSGCDSCWTCFSFSCGRGKAAASQVS